MTDVGVEFPSLDDDDFVTVSLLLSFPHAPELSFHAKVFQILNCLCLAKWIFHMGARSHIRQFRNFSGGIPNVIIL